MLSGYKRVLYIENTSSAGIYLGVNPTGYTHVRIKFELTSGSNDGGIIFGCRTSSNDTWRFFRYQDVFYFDCINESQRLVSATTFELNKLYDLRLGDRFILDAKNARIIAAGTRSGDPTYVGSEQLRWDSNAQVKIYGTKIYSNNTLVKNFVPCVRESDNTAGLYETLSDTFLTSYTSSSYSYQAITSGNIVSVYQDGLKTFSKLYMNGRTPDRMYYNGVTYNVYNEYDQISDDPSGWNKVWDYTGNWVSSFTTNSLQIRNAPTFGDDEARWSTTQMYDLSNYSKLELTIKCNQMSGFDTSYANQYPFFYLGTGTNPSSGYDWVVFDQIIGGYLFDEGISNTDYFEYTLSYDLTGVTGNHYIMFSCHSKYLIEANFTLYNVRLYKSI